MTKQMRTITLGFLIVGAMAWAPKTASAALTITTGKFEAAPGKQVKIPITLKGIKDVKDLKGGISGLTMRLKYDSGLLTFKSLEKGPVVPNATMGKDFDEKADPGILAFGIVCDSKTPESKEFASIEQDGIVLNLVFEVNEKASGGQKCTLKLDNWRVLDAGNIELPVTTEDGDFTVTGGLPWLWIAIGAGVAVFLLLILLILASRGGGNQQRGPMYTMPQGAPYGVPQQQQGGHGGYVPPRFTPEGAPATFAHACKKCGGIIQLPRAMMGQTFQCGACGATQVAGS